VNENDLLRSIAGRWSDDRRVDTHVLVGPGDDCAVLGMPSASESSRLVVGVDQLVEGRHFAADAPVDLIARKAVGRAVSDLAAMAATPAWALATALYDPADTRIDALAEAIHRWGMHWGCPVVGGDLASWGAGGVDAEEVGRSVGVLRPLVLTVTAAGSVPPTKPPVALRSSAQPGDMVWVTGRFGGSLESGRHLLVTPRVREALILREKLGDGLHAMIDVSDGLGLDAHRIAQASGVRIEIEADRVPMHADVVDWRRACGDGEDYELCFTTPRDRLDGLAGWPTDVPLTRIGRVVGVDSAGEGSSSSSATTIGAVVVDADGVVYDASSLGWDHGRR